MKKRIDPSYRNAFRTAVFVRCANMMTGFIDGILTSTFLGTEAMTAYGIALSYFMLVSILTFLMETGSGALYSAKIGQNRTDEANNVFALSAWMSIAISTVMSVAGVVFAEPIARLFGARGDAAYLVPQAAGYLRWLFAGTLFYDFISVSSGALQMDGGTKLVRISGIVVCTVDIAGDLLNVFVFHGGLSGMGAATTISSICGAAILLTYFFRKKRLFSLNPIHVRFGYLREMLHLGSSQAIYGIASFFGNIAINHLIIARAGVNTMFGLSVFKNVVLFVNPICCAVGDACFLLMGMYIGEGSREDVERTDRISKKIIGCIIPLGILMILFSGMIAKLYTAGQTAEAARSARTAVIVLGFQIPFTALFLYALKSLMAFRNTKASSYMNIAKACVFPCGLLLIFAGMGDVAVYASLAAAEALSAVLTAVLYYREKRKSSLLQIPEEDIISAEVTTEKEAVDFSIAAASFCEGHAVDARIGHSVSLCAEEMAACLIRHGRECRVEPPVVNIKLLIRDEKITMRVRDNCPLNDLRKRAEEWSLNDENPDRFIGTRMALMLSDDFQYIPIMDQNNTTISFDLSDGKAAQGE